MSSKQLLTEEVSTSSVEQLCTLREMIKSPPTEHTKIVLIASEYFIERVKLYVDYIFGSTEKFEFIGSSIPTALASDFSAVESEKHSKAAKWLAPHKKGDYRSILKEQKEFESKVKQRQVSHPQS
jgi:hypothetical protein